MTETSAHPVTEPMIAISKSGQGWWRAPGFARPAILVAFTLLIFVAGRFFSAGLPSWGAAEAILTQSLFIAVLAFGQGLVMLIGGLDLSIPGVIALSAMVLAQWSAEPGRSAWIGLLLALGAAVLVGLLNGFLIALFRIPAFIITLAMNGVLIGVTIGMKPGSAAPSAPAALVHLFSGSGKVLGLGIPVLVFVLVGVVGYLVQARSRWGRTVALRGSSEPAARLSGVPVRRVEISVYVIGALSSGVAGVMLLGFTGNAMPTLGVEWMMPAIAAVLVGGTVIGSGFGFWQSTFAATVLLTTITVVIQATGFSQGWKSVLYGLVILLALLLMGGGGQNPVSRLTRMMRTRSS